MMPYDDIFDNYTKPPYLADEESFIANAKWATKQGLEVLVSRPDELFLDYDFPEVSSAQYMLNRGKASEVISVLQDNDVRIIKSAFTRSSGGNIHGILTLNKEFGEVERLGLEMSLGSDPKRGMLSIVRYSYGLRGVSRLFRPEKLEVLDIYDARR